MLPDCLVSMITAAFLLSLTLTEMYCVGSCSTGRLVRESMVVIGEAAVCGIRSRVEERGGGLICAGD
jgi:hypothetical protein